MPEEFELNEEIKIATENTAFDFITKNCPSLLETIRTFVKRGLKPEQIIDICAERTNQPRHRLAFIGCAAGYLIREKV